LVRGLAEGLPNGRFALIAHAGHLPSIEQPATMAAIIAEFLQEIGYV
jgi:pimeloyl-ACP methyl ester carboxylesterase